MVVDLGTAFDATSGDISAANENGHAVGVVSSSVGLVPILVANGKIYNLNDLLPAASGWHRDSAFDINASGAIPGQDESERKRMATRSRSSRG